MKAILKTEGVLYGGFKIVKTQGLKEKKKYLNLFCFEQYRTMG